MAAEEVLPYRAFRKTTGAPILYWMAYRAATEGGYAGTTVMPTTRAVFTAPSEERLREMAKELGYSIRPAPAG